MNAVRCLLFIWVILLNDICQGFSPNRGGVGGNAHEQQQLKHQGLSSAVSLQRHPILFGSYLDSLESQSTTTPNPTADTAVTSDDANVQSQIDEYLVASRSQKQIKEYLMAIDPTLSSMNDDDNDKKQNLMKQIKDSGIAGIISFGVVQTMFWAISTPLVVIAFWKVTGHFPDFGNQNDLEKLGVEAFTYLNIARLAAPFRIGVSLSLVPWIQSNVVDRFQKQNR